MPVEDTSIMPFTKNEEIDDKEKFYNPFESQADSDNDNSSESHGSDFMKTVSANHFEKEAIETPEIQECPKETVARGLLTTHSPSEISESHSTVCTEMKGGRR